MTEPPDIVRAGYDAMAERHLEWIAEIEGDPRLRFLDALLARLPDGSGIVDLGCGAGVPNTALLAERHHVLGIDISNAQLELARERVPTARFLQADMAEVELSDARCDALVACYSLTHVPRDVHAELLARMRAWLRPLVTAAGFELVVDEVVTMHEPEGPSTFLWVLAQATKTSSRTS